MRFVLTNATVVRLYTEARRSYHFSYTKTFNHTVKGKARIADEHEPTSTDAEMQEVFETRSREKHLQEGGLRENLEFNLAVNRHQHMTRLKLDDKPEWAMRKDKSADKSDRFAETVHTVPVTALMGV